MKELYDLLPTTGNSRRLFSLFPSKTDTTTGFTVPAETLQTYKVDATKLTKLLQDQTERSNERKINDLIQKYKLNAFELKEMSGSMKDADMNAELTVTVDVGAALKLFAKGMQKAMAVASGAKDGKKHKQTLDDIQAGKCI